MIFKCSRAQFTHVTSCSPDTDTPFPAAIVYFQTLSPPAHADVCSAGSQCHLVFGALCLNPGLPHLLSAFPPPWMEVPTGPLLYLCVRELEPWLLAVGEDLPQDDPEAPHVALRREPPVHDALGGHPADGEHGVSSHLEGVETEAQRAWPMAGISRGCLQPSYVHSWCTLP